MVVCVVCTDCSTVVSFDGREILAGECGSKSLGGEK